MLFNSLYRVDWELLHKQKLVLLELLEGMSRDSAQAEAMWGIVHLLDALQDDAAAAGRWTFPDEDTRKGEAECHVKPDGRKPRRR
jgi:hypothetical protein